MALKINTNIQNDFNEYLLDARAVRGGYNVVSGTGIDLKENLPPATLVVGSLVYDAKEDKSYRWTGTEWKSAALEVSTDRSNTFTKEQIIDGGQGGITLTPAGGDKPSCLKITNTQGGTTLNITATKLEFTDSEGELKVLAFEDIATKDDTKQFSTVDTVPEDLGTDQYVFVRIFNDTNK